MPPNLYQIETELDQLKLTIVELQERIDYLLEREEWYDELLDQCGMYDEWTKRTGEDPK